MKMINLNCTEQAQFCVYLVTFTFNTSNLNLLNGGGGGGVGLRGPQARRTRWGGTRSAA